jgi:hypothetical protein
VLGSVGEVYTVREWAGLWAGGQQRYTVGQRAMFFFHAPGAGGLSSPVDGMEGVVPLVPMGASAEPVLDVRRLAARVVRARGAALEGDGAASLADAVAVARQWRSRAAEPGRMALPAAMQPRPVDASPRFVPIAMTR